MPRFLAIFTTVFTLSAAGAQANNLVLQQHNVYAPNGITVAEPLSTEAFWQINTAGTQERYADLVRVADGKRSDPADAGDLLIQMAKSPTFGMEGIIQTVNYGWITEAVARTDPADAGYLLQPLLVADAGF